MKKPFKRTNYKDLGLPMTPKQTDFFDKHCWSKEGITRFVAQGKIYHWLLNRRKDRIIVAKFREEDRKREEVKRKKKL